MFQISLFQVKKGKMPPIYFQKPEAALKRAEELIKVDKEADALETLHDTIKVDILAPFCLEPFSSTYF